jgi:hypothetical protein
VYSSATKATEVNVDVLLIPTLLILVGPGLILVGVVFFTLGLNHAGHLQAKLGETPEGEPDAQLAGADTTFSELLAGFAKVAQALVLDKSTALWQRITASGLLLIYLGLLYLVIAIIPVAGVWIASIVTDKPAATSSETPSPSVTPSPAAISAP